MLTISEQIDHEVLRKVDELTPLVFAEALDKFMCAVEEFERNLVLKATGLIDLVSNYKALQGFYTTAKIQLHRLLRRYESILWSPRCSLVSTAPDRVAEARRQIRKLKDTRMQVFEQIRALRPDIKYRWLNKLSFGACKSQL